MENGRIELLPGKAVDADCDFRCHYPMNDYKVRYGDALNLSHTPDCDIIQVQCKNSTIHVVYENLHTQIFVPKGGRSDTATQNLPETDERASPSPKKSRQMRPPDVHLLVLDSVSSPQLTRSMPKSLLFLLDEMGAINFRHFSKIGVNSRPNAYALLFGKQPYSLKNIGSLSIALPADTDDWEFCSTALDDQPFVGFEFKRQGYKTMIAEDWALGALNWPNCTGFTRAPPADHYMRPMQLLYDTLDMNFQLSDNNRYWENVLFKSRCKQMHDALLDYFKQFVDAYTDKPKFSLTWLDLTHNGPNGLYQLDDAFLQLLKGYKPKLDNAFFFIMGDHGLRFGDIRATKQGEIEDNNPAMVLVVSEHLRRNQRLMANLKANSKHLMTHYDTYATLVSIAREGAGMTADSSFLAHDTREWNLTLHGESYFYPFDTNIPRNCANQRIPFEYCICQNKAEDCSESKAPLARRIDAFVVSHMNEFIQSQNATEICAELTSNSESKVELFRLTSDPGIYKVALTTLPGGGRYSTHVKVSNEGNVDGKEAFAVVAHKIVRLDSYEDQSKCTTVYELRPFCYCRNLLNTPPS